MTSQTQICQTIINEETGEICGHEENEHNLYGCMETLKCPCKKFSPQKKQEKRE